MRVNNQFEFGDRELRQIAQDGMGQRSGKASRKMVRLWLNKLVSRNLATMAEPKIRRRKEKPDTEIPDALAAAMGIICVHCSRLFEEHGAQGRACPVSRNYNKPTRFKARTRKDDE